jgi:uncharacterized coiled-coil protein SlyX
MSELAQLEYDYTVHSDRMKADDKLYVRFFMDVLPDDEATKTTGIKKFRDVEMVQIMVPGDKRNITIREARDSDKVRFARHYERFQANNKEEALDGFPLSQWGLLSKAQTEELRYLGFRTVEHVANANDSVMNKYPGLRELSKRAAAWLQAQANAAPVEKLNSALAERDQTIAAMKAQMDEMQKALAALNTAKKAA